MCPQWAAGGACNASARRPRGPAGESPRHPALARGRRGAEGRAGPAWQDPFCAGRRVGGAGPGPGLEPEARAGQPGAHTQGECLSLGAKTSRGVAGARPSIAAVERGGARNRRPSHTKDGSDAARLPLAAGPASLTRVSSFPNSSPLTPLLVPHQARLTVDAGSVEAVKRDYGPITLQFVLPGKPSGEAKM